MVIQSQKAYLFGLITVLLWSTVATAFKLSLRYLDPLQLLLYADLTSMVVLTFLLLIQGKGYQLRSVSRRDFLMGVWLGFLNPFLYYLVLFKAYELLPAQEAQPLNYTWALTLMLFSACWLLALKYAVNNSRVGNLIFFSPFLSLVFIRFLLGEPILPSTLVGLGFITAGLMIQRWPGVRIPRRRSV